jgi:hypothetical protein
MSNMKYPNFPGFDTPIDQIGIAPCTQRARPLLSHQAATLGILADEFDRLPNGAFDV